jgi:hypothetical protein
MSDHGAGTAIQVAPNDMFPRGKGYVTFFFFNSLCIPGWCLTCDPPKSASQLLGLHVCYNQDT